MACGSPLRQITHRSLAVDLGWRTRRHPSSWVFLRNLAAANVLFTGLVLLARFKIPAWPSLEIKSAEPAKVRVQ